MKKIFILLVILSILPILFLSPGCKKKAGDLPLDIVAMVNGETISLEELEKKFEITKNQYDIITPKNEVILNNLKRNLLKELIEKKIMLQEARRLNIKISEDELKEIIHRIKKSYPDETFQQKFIDEKISYQYWEKELREDLTIEELISSKIDNQVLVTDAEIEEYFKKHKDSFTKPKQVRARHIVLKTEEEAQEIRKLLLKKRVKFIEMAKEKSISPDAQDGGDLGFFVEGQMPPEFEITFSLKVGKISKVIKTPYGYHIFKVEEKRKEEKQEFSEVAELIRGKMIKIKQNEKFQEWLTELKNNSKININQKIDFLRLSNIQKPNNKKEK